MSIENHNNIANRVKYIQSIKKFTSLVVKVMVWQFKFNNHVNGCADPPQTTLQILSDAIIKQVPVNIAVEQELCFSFQTPQINDVSVTTVI